TLRQTLHVIDTIGNVREYRVRRVTYDPTGATADIEGAPVLFDLATIGYLLDENFAFSISAVTLTAAQWIDNFILPTLEAYGVTWIGRGSIEYTQPITLTFSAWTPLQLLREIETQLGAELGLVRNGDGGYLI